MLFFFAAAAASFSFRRLVELKFGAFSSSLAHHLHQWARILYIRHTVQSAQVTLATRFIQVILIN